MNAPTVERMTATDWLIVATFAYVLGRRRGHLDQQRQQVPASAAAYLMGFEHGMAEAARRAAGP